MAAPVHVLMRMPDGTLACGLGTPATPVNNAGTLQNMAPLILLASKRIEDLLWAGVAVGTDEIQRFDIIGGNGKGSFSLAFNGSETSTPITNQPSPGPPPREIEDALTALSTVGPDNLVVTQDQPYGYVIAFGGALGSQDLPQITAPQVSIGGGGSLTVATTTNGAPPLSGGVTATSAPDPGGRLLLHLADATGASWVYRVLPAIVADSDEVAFLGLFVAPT